MRNNIKECFDYYDRDGDQKIKTEDLGKVMRSLGYAPTNKDLIDLINEFDSIGVGFLDYAKVEDCIVQFISRSTSKEASVKKAFDTLDEDKDGRVTIGDLKHVLTKIGDKLSDEEVNKALSDAGFNPENVNEELNLDAFLRITGLSK